jgi:hypothetical protein
MIAAMIIVSVTQNPGVRGMVRQPTRAAPFV